MTDLGVNELHYGDNLEVLREKIPDEVADLIYLDPPFNSSRSYNLLFKQVKGEPSPAQIHAFEDTWTWSPLLYEQFKADRRNARLFELIEALYRILGASEMMAYVLMMAPPGGGAVVSRLPVMARSPGSVAPATSRARRLARRQSADHQPGRA